MTTTNLTAFPFQIDIAKSRKPFCFILGGRRIGKGHGMMLKILVHIAQRHAQMRRAHVVIVGPSQPQGRRAFWSFLNHPQLIPEALVSKRNATRLELTLNDGSTIRIGSADKPHSLRGETPTPTLIVLDELREFKAEVYSEVLLPVLADRFQSTEFVMGSTPDGVGSNLHQLYVDACSDDNFDVFHLDAEVCRPDLKDRHAILKQKMSPQAYNQEVRAQFSKFGNRVFYEFDEIHHVIKDIDRKPEERIHVYVDFNVSVMASAAAVVRGDSIYFFKEFQGAHNTDQLIEILVANFDPRKTTIYPDPSADSRKTSAAFGVTDIALFRKAGFTVNQKSRISVHDSVNEVNARLRNAEGQKRMFITRDCRNLILSLAGTQWSNMADKSSALIDKSKGVEHHSDGVRYLIHTLYPINASAMSLGGSIMR